jgi:hypothetical protein
MVLSALQILIHLILKTSIQSKDYYYPHFTNEEIKVHNGYG